jgi:uncharacterized surface protein with fasciclin (FAS1) repeats
MLPATLRKPLLGVMMVLVLAMSVFVAGCGSDDENSDAAATENSSSMEQESGTEVGGAMMSPEKDVVANASEASNLTTLVELVGAAGLVETLQGDGPFTVFAPDNDAFAAVPKETLDTLTDPANKDQLAAVLTYHVVPEELDAAAITELANNGETITTVQGEKLTPKVEDGMVMIEDASGNTVTVTQADVMQSNGVAHVIDGVLIPKQ